MILCAIFALATVSSAWALGPQVDYKGPIWEILMDDAGYSPQLWNYECERTLLSGEWAAAIHYRNIEEYTGGAYSMWLTDYFDGTCRPGPTNSNFVSTMSGADMYCGISSSAIANNEVAIVIDYFMDCENETPMGWCPPVPKYVMSRPQVLVQRYTIRNISPVVLYDVEFFQVLISNVADTEGDDLGVFDPNYYSSGTPPGPYDAFHIDITEWGNVGEPEECWEFINFGAQPQPLDICGVDVDECLAIIQKVENNALANIPACTRVGPTFIGGALKWCIGTMDQGQEVTIEVVLTMNYWECCNTPVPEIEFDAGSTWGCIKALYR